MAGPQANIPVLRLLLTEDNPADAELELRELKRAGLRIAHRIADTEQGFVSALREFSPDVILSDFSMPGFDGMAALALARDLAPDTPFIFVSGTLGEEYAIRALRNGAADYVLKTNMVRLPPTVDRAVKEAAHRAQRNRDGQLLALEHTVVRHLADADSASEGLKSVIRAICETEGWDLGLYYRADARAGLLRFEEAWS